MYRESSSWKYWYYHHGNPLRWDCWMPGWKWWKLRGRQDNLGYCCCCAVPDNDLYLPLLGSCKVANLEKFHVAGFWPREHCLKVKAFWLLWYERKFFGKIKGICVKTFSCMLLDFKCLWQSHRRLFIWLFPSSLTLLLSPPPPPPPSAAAAHPPVILQNCLF